MPLSQIWPFSFPNWDTYDFSWYVFLLILFLGLLLCLFNVRQSTGGYIPGPDSCPQLGLCVTPPWLNCYSQLRHDLQRGFTVTNAMLCHPPTKILKCTAKQSAVCSTNGFIWECKGLATMIKTCQAPDSSHVVLSPFSVLPLPLFSPLWRAIACRLLFHVLLQKTAAHQTVRSVAFLLPPSTATSHAILGRALAEQRCIFLSKRQRYFSRALLISVSLTKCWRCREEEEALMRPPSDPWGQRGSWWAVETI